MKLIANILANNEPEMSVPNSIAAIALYKRNVPLSRRIKLAKEHGRSQ